MAVNMKIIVLWDVVLCSLETQAASVSFDRFFQKYAPTKLHGLTFRRLSFSYPQRHYDNFKNTAKNMHVNST